MAIEGTHYTNEVIRAADLFTTQPGIAGYVFDNCLIVGPAMVAYFNSVLDTCGFEGSVESVVYRIDPPRELAVGVLGFFDCAFNNCRFQQIGVMVPADDYEEMVIGLRGDA